MSIEIREITNEPIEPNAAFIRCCYQTVADEMGITPENAPRYTAFITDEWLEEERANGAVFYGYFIDGVKAGFVTLEQEHEHESKWFMKRLCVLPDYRSHRIGRKLVDHIIACARKREIDTLHIGIVDEQKGLKDWYIKIGFSEYERFEIPNLPFSVSLLSMNLNGRQGG